MTTTIINSKDIRRAFTEKVNEYIAKGMDISIRSMAGHQGEVCKIDLTDGKYIYRIRLEKGHRFLEGDNYFFGGYEVVELIVERYEDDFRNDFDTWGTLWSGQGDFIEKKIWYSIDSHDSNAFVESRDELVRILKFRAERRDAKRTEQKEVTDDRRINLIFKMVRKHKGYASVSKKAIKKVVRCGNNGYTVYFTRESKKGTVTV